MDKKKKAEIIRTDLTKEIYLCYIQLQLQCVTRFLEALTIHNRNCLCGLVSLFCTLFQKKSTDRLKRCKTAETLLVKSINYTRSKKMKDKIFSVLQRVGRSFMLPIAILPVAGLLLGIGSSFTNATTIETYGLTSLLGNGTRL